MQVGPMKPTLKAPGTKRLKLKYDVPQLNFAFEFNLRRYIEAVNDALLASIVGGDHDFLLSRDNGEAMDPSASRHRGCRQGVLE